MATQVFSPAENPFSYVFGKSSTSLTISLWNFARILCHQAYGFFSFFTISLWSFRIISFAENNLSVFGAFLFHTFRSDQSLIRSFVDIPYHRFRIAILMSSSLSHSPNLSIHPYISIFIMSYIRDKAWTGMTSVTRLRRGQRRAMLENGNEQWQ